MTTFKERRVELSKEELSLPLELGKLEIESTRAYIFGNTNNPFVISHKKQSLFTKTLTHSLRCTCVHSKKSDMIIPIFKKKSRKILKEPTLKLIQENKIDDNTLSILRYSGNSFCVPQIPLSQTYSQYDNTNLGKLVDNCNQLKISTDNSIQKFDNDVIHNSEWWKNNTSETAQSSKENSLERGRNGPSCSQEALNPPCDVTIDELASYFETLVHIPKKMSSMAEMMYI